MTSEVDRDLEAWCALCGLGTPHGVLSTQGGRTHRVRCLSCNDTHLYESSAPTPPSESVPEVTPMGEFDVLLDGRETDTASRYNVDETYECSDIIKHPGLGVGIVVRLIGATLMDVRFPTGMMCLVCGR